APASANTRAVAAPMPDAPPVTIAIFPSSRFTRTPSAWLCSLVHEGDGFHKRADARHSPFPAAGPPGSPLIRAAELADGEGDGGASAAGPARRRARASGG